MILQRVACFSMTRYQQDRGRSSRKRERKKSRTFRIHPKTFISKKIPFRAIILYLSLILSKSKVERGERKYMYTFNFSNELRINFINEPWWTLITIGNCRITLVISRLWCILRVLVSLAPFHDSRREIVRNHLSRSSYVVEKLRESLNLDRLIQKNEIFAIRLINAYDTIFKYLLYRSSTSIYLSSRSRTIRNEFRFMGGLDFAKYLFANNLW